MYGLVNSGFQDLIVAEHGQSVWDEIASSAGVSKCPFVSLRAYDDELSYRLVGAAAKVLGVPAERVLERFGEHWVVFTAARGYGALLDLCGHDIVDFINQLDSIHARMKLVLPDLQPPSMTCTVLGRGRLRVDYSSTRSGLGPMVTGLLRGLGRRFGVPLEIERVVPGAGEPEHFFVTVLDAA